MPSAPTKIVFLIDEQSLMKQHTSLDHLQLCIMRTLLFYHSQQLEVRWGFRFFSTKVKYTADSIRRFYPMNEEHFDAMEREYNKREKSRPKEGQALTAPIVKIKQLLRETIGDFQWETTDLCTVIPATKNYIYLFTACPGDLKEMNLFFVSPNLDQNDMMDLDSTPPSSYPAQFQEAKENLAEFVKSYQERNISINIVDTYNKKSPCNVYEQKISGVIKQGFQSLFGQFDGTIISLDQLTASYNIYGHSFISEFVNILPCAMPATTTTKRMLHQVPVWKGPFKTRQGNSIGNFALYPSLKKGFYQSNTLAYVSGIRTVNVIHASQFSASWLLNDSTTPTQDYKLIYEEGESPKLFNIVLDQLYAMQSILIAELVPMNGYEQLAQKVSIEPFSKSSASLRFLNVQHIPNATAKTRMTTAVDEDYPVGTYITSTHLEYNLPQETPIVNQLYKINLDAPIDIRKKLQSRKADVHKDRKGKKSTKNASQQPKQEKQAVKVIQLPADVNMMGKELKKLYLELLYTQDDTVDNAITIIDSWINHLLKNNSSKMDIISTLFDYTMSFEDLDMKHNNEIPQTTHQRPTGQSTLEQTYLYEWWCSVRTRGTSDPRFEKKSCIVLKVKEARLQVILYCFITRLVIDWAGNIKRDPCEQAEKFFKRIVLLYSYHDINDFLTELDSEEGPEAVKRRDPADLNECVLMGILEKRFNDLSDLTTGFREAAGMDEMASSPGSFASADEDYNADDNMFTLDLPSPEEKPQNQNFFQVPQQRPTPSRRSQFNNNVRKTDTPMKLTPTKPPTTPASKPKQLLPIRMERSSSNKTLDQFMKRSINVKSTNGPTAESRRSDATQAAIAKVNRSAQKGVPTMKRAYSFTTSAHSPKRAKRHESTLSYGDTSTVVLRKETRAPDPQLTPRTSMNRFLNTNIYHEYAEHAMSPSKTAQAAEEERLSSQLIRSSYPAIPKTPQGTPHRYRKAMLGRISQPEDLEEEEFSVLKSDERESKQPPYTPRTSARRERDRIDRNTVVRGTDLTSKLLQVKEEGNSQVSRPVIKKGHPIFGSDSEDEEDIKMDQEEDYFSSTMKRNENVNPFMTPQSAAPPDDMSQPVTKKMNIDILFREDDSEEDSDQTSFF